jgi:hypothetical protein
MNMWDVVILTYLMYTLSTCLEGLRENMKDIGRIADA